MNTVGNAPKDTTARGGVESLESTTYTKTATDNLLSGKASSSHTHDDRYYTETEITSLLSNKANTSQLPFAAYPSNNIDAIPDNGKIYNGIKNNTGYITFNLGGWIYLQFQVNSSAVFMRQKYGNNGWTTWYMIQSW